MRREIQSVSQFLQEIFRIVQVDRTKLDSFIQELEQTIFKETIDKMREICEEDYLAKSYDELESHLIDGAPVLS